MGVLQTVVCTPPSTSKRVEVASRHGARDAGGDLGNEGCQLRVLGPLPFLSSEILHGHARGPCYRLKGGRLGRGAPSDRQLPDRGPADLPLRPPGHVSRGEVAGEHNGPDHPRAVLFLAVSLLPCGPCSGVSLAPPGPFPYLTSLSHHIITINVYYFTRIALQFAHV
jgi:hypothetical protein